MNRFRNRGIDREIIQERMVCIFIHVRTYIWIFLSMYSQWSWQPSSNEHTQTWDILVLNKIPLGKELGILIFDKGQTQKKNWAKIVFSTNGTETTGFPHAKKTQKSRRRFYTFTINLKWITDLKTTKLQNFW